MATSLENRWWRDVIEQGKNSRHYFDIDWTRPVTLPFLGDTFEAELESGALELKRDPATGKPAFIYYDQVWPLNPQTLATGEQLLTSRIATPFWRCTSAKLAPYVLAGSARQLSWRRF
jgi:(1->4)-alpha-D-glucan 1-alpha-D-glucosylmutase